MFDDFDTQVQYDELSEVLDWNDMFDDPRYVYEE